jgi:hypothetical protein
MDSETIEDSIIDSIDYETCKGIVDVTIQTVKYCLGTCYSK